MAETSIHAGSQIAKVFTHGKWYILSSMATKGLNLLLLPVYTRYLPPEEYGLLNVLLSIVSVISIFISLYLDTAYERFFFEQKDEENLAKLFSTLFLFVLAWGIFIVPAAMLISKAFIVERLQVPFFPYIPIVMGLCLVKQVQSFGQSHYKCNLQAKTITSILIFTALVNAAVSVTLLAVYDMGVMARLLGMLVASLLALLLYGYLFVKDDVLTLDFNLGMLIQSLSYSLPLLPRLLSGWIVSASDRILLALYATMADTGIYAVGYVIGGTLLIFENAVFNFVYGPIMLSMLVENPDLAKVRIANFFQFYCWLFVMLALFVSLFSREIIYVMAAPSFADAYRIVPFIAFAYVFSALQKPFNQILRYQKVTWLISAGAIVHALINLVLNIILIPIFGRVAAAWTTMVAFLALFAWMFFWSQKYNKVILRVDSIISLIAIVTVCIILYGVIEKYCLEISIAFWLKIGIMVFALVLSFVLPVFTPQQRRQARVMIFNRGT